MSNSLKASEVPHIISCSVRMSLVRRRLRSRTRIFVRLIRCATSRSFLKPCTHTLIVQTEVHVHLITGCDEEYPDRQIDNLSQVQATFGTLGIALTYEFSESGHDRSIVTDTGWRVILGRGLTSTSVTATTTGSIH